MLFGVTCAARAMSTWLLRHIGRGKIHAHLFCQQFSTAQSRRAVSTRLPIPAKFSFLILLFEQARQLAHGGGFARTLQARHQHGGRRRGEAGFSALFSLPISSVKACSQCRRRLGRALNLWQIRAPKRSFTWFTKSFTIGNATSASSSARRTSRSASLMLSSVSVALPRMFLNTLENRLVRVV